MEVHGLGGSILICLLPDLQKVVDGGPWSFEQSTFIVPKLKDNEDPHIVKLHEFKIWVRIYDLPRGCVSENILKNIGMTIGRYVKSEPINMGGMCKSYMRIRVVMNVEKSLKRRMKIKR